MQVKKMTTKISAQVAEQIEDSIMSGSVKAGEKLPSVNELCEMFGVGRSAVRDALNTLKGKGMVDIQHGEGTFVCDRSSWWNFDDLISSSAKSIKDVYAVRQLLEIGAAEMAARSRTQKHLDQMKRSIEDLQQVNKIDPWKADIHFHLAMAEATNNDVMLKLMQTTSSYTEKALIDLHKLTALNPVLAQSIVKQHVRIYEAILNQDTELAKAAMQEHLTFCAKPLTTAK